MPEKLAGSITGDAADKLCFALYSRKAQPRDYVGGSDARMLGDAAGEICHLRAENQRLRKVADAARLHLSHYSVERDGEEVLTRDLLERALGESQS